MFAGCNPAKTCNKLDLPHPDGPESAKCCPVGKITEQGSCAFTS
ncbi:hypothetical protein JCM19237_1788 [Photobacterium aphoticum]|uniref:Uncharacterized protein n=1 Tax=Photobacterium aphoticum TaxID=754436 RepID=A0A090QV59_9GAMM|nr:hypothetical protein JCM19237_1788 [Photobacterium aphoticum]